MASLFVPKLVEVVELVLKWWGMLGGFVLQSKVRFRIVRAFSHSVAVAHARA